MCAPADLCSRIVNQPAHRVSVSLGSFIEVVSNCGRVALSVKWYVGKHSQPADDPISRYRSVGKQENVLQAKADHHTRTTLVHYGLKMTTPFPPGLPTQVLFEKPRFVTRWAL